MDVVGLGLPVGCWFCGLFFVNRVRHAHVVHLSERCRGRETSHLPPFSLITIMVFSVKRVRTDFPCMSYTDSVSPPPPYPFPAERCKEQPRKRVGKIINGNRTVTHRWVIVVDFSPFRFLNLFFVSGSASFAVFFSFSLLRVAVRINFSGASFCVLGISVGRVFFGVFFLES